MNFDKMIDDITKERWRTELYTTCSMCNKEYTFDEFMNAKWKWVNPKDHKYGKTTLCDCGVDIFMDRWGIVSKMDNYFVMTIHLPIPHGGVEFQDWMDRGFWYETKFWQQDPGQPREFAAFEQRYHTREEAIKGHKFVSENLSKIVENPEGFPQGILSMMSNSIKAVEAEKKVISSDVKNNLK